MPAGIVAAVICLNAAGAEPESAEKILLRWSPDGAFRFKTTLEQKVEGDGPPTSMVNRIACDVEAKKGAEEIRLRLFAMEREGTFKGKKLVARLRRGKEPELESVDSGDRKEMRKMNAWVQEDLKAKLTPSGVLTVRSRTPGGREMPSAALGIILPRLPEKPVAVGETWTTQERFPLPGPDLATTMTFRLDRVTDTEAHAVIETTPPGKGELLFSRRDGLVKSMSLSVQKKDGNSRVRSFSLTLTVEPAR
jgi:hypothetical protein